MKRRHGGFRQVGSNDLRRQDLTLSHPSADPLDMLTILVRSLVDHPEDVQVEAVPTENGLVYRIQANPSDTGKLIGANGRTARALRIILGANAARLKQNLSLDILQQDRAAI